jgi:hypothetical protein
MITTDRRDHPRTIITMIPPIVAITLDHHHDDHYRSS